MAPQNVFCEYLLTCIDKKFKDLFEFAEDHWDELVEGSDEETNFFLGLWEDVEKSMSNFAYIIQEFSHLYDLEELARIFMVHGKRLDTMGDKFFNERGTMLFKRHAWARAFSGGKALVDQHIVYFAWCCRKEWAHPAPFPGN